MEEGLDPIFGWSLAMSGNLPHLYQHAWTESSLAHSVMLSQTCCCSSNVKCFALETCLMFYTLVTFVEVLWAQCDAYYFNHLRLHLGAKLCAVTVGFLSLRFSFHTPFRRMKGFNETACAESTIMGTSRMPLFSFRARGTEWSGFLSFSSKETRL